MATLVEALDPMDAAIFDAVIELEEVEARREQRYDRTERVATLVWRLAQIAALVFIVAEGIR